MWFSLPGAQLTQRHKHSSEGINEDLGSVWAGSHCFSYCDEFPTPTQNMGMKLLSASQWSFFTYKTRD